MVIVTIDPLILAVYCFKFAFVGPEIAEPSDLNLAPWPGHVEIPLINGSIALPA